jgi:nicotinamide riboside transporter PnuC
MIIRTIDNWVIDKVEKRCHAFQRLTGRTNYWLMGKVDMVLTFSFLAIICGFLAGQSTLLFGGKPSFGDAAFSLIFIMVMLFNGFYGWKRLEDKAFQRLEKGTMNPEKIDWLSHLIRMTGLFLNTVVRLLQVATHRVPWDVAIIDVCMVLHFYLLACDPLPPCKGTFSLRNLFSALNPVLNEG